MFDINPSFPAALPTEQFLGRGHFLRLATQFQGSLLLVALGLAVLAGIDLPVQWRFTVSTACWGIGATVPMLLVFAITHRFPVGPFRGIKEFLSSTLGETLTRCRWYDLAYVSLLAGVSEEVMFRGVIQTWIGGWSLTAGLVVSSVLFGLAHCVTVTYAILAGLLGLYLGVLFTITGEANLVPPIVCHALYDFVALSVFQADARRAKACRATKSIPSGESTQPKATAE